MVDVEEIKKLSIVEYLSARGIQSKKTGSKYFCSSPFSRDTNWSFCVYPSNTFFDFSTGAYGDIISLCMQIDQVSYVEAINRLSNSSYSIIQPNYKQYRKEDSIVEFSYTKFVTRRDDEVKAIQEYAMSRGILEGYMYGVFFTKQDDSEEFIRHPSLMFLHVDVNFKPTGAKFRKIDARNKSERFSSRGRLGFYILDYTPNETFEEKKLFLAESETSANSLYMYLKENKVNCVVISCGGVSSVPKRLPDKYKELKDKRLIIDYDGEEELYLKRVSLYKNLGLTPIKLRLPRGEDMNSLYCENKLHLINHLIL
jgi:hypothetical protein